MDDVGTSQAAPLSQRNSVPAEDPGEEEGLFAREVDTRGTSQGEPPTGDGFSQMWSKPLALSDTDDIDWDGNVRKHDTHRSGDDSPAPDSERHQTQEEKAERKRRRKERKERRRKEREKNHELKGKKKTSTKSKNDERVFSKGPTYADDQAAYGETDADARSLENEEDSGDSEQNEKKFRKRRKAEMTEREASEVTRAMVQRMLDAAAEDDEALANGKPSLAKLKLLDEAFSEISKPKWIHWFLREGVCQALARWLSLLPGTGALPNITIRTRILQLLQRIPISIEHLRGSDLGRRLISMWKSSDELEENRAMIRSIVHSLLRPVFGLRLSHQRGNLDAVECLAGVDDPEATASAGTGHGYRPPTDSTAIVDVASDLGGSARGPSRRSVNMEGGTALGSAGSSSTHYAAVSRHARIPTQSSLSYKVMPKSNFKGLHHDGQRDSESTVARLTRMIACKKTVGNRKANRAQNVSVSKYVS